MRHLVVFAIAVGLGLVTPLPVHAQPALLSTETSSDSADLASTSGSSAAQQTSAPAPVGPDITRGLFEPTWHQFQIGGRFSSVDGDPARWQRYQDLRDGVLFTDARYER